jgi:hypothetical protein
MSDGERRALVRASWFYAGLRLTEVQLDPVEQACPLCLAAEPRPSVFRLQTNPDVDLLSCAACGGYSASRMPTPEALRSYYRDYYKGAEERVIFDLRQRLALHIFRRAFHAVPKRRIDILEVFFRRRGSA